MSNIVKASTNQVAPTTTSQEVDSATDSYLRAAPIVEAINENLPDKSKLPAIPAEYVFRKRDRETVSTAIHAAFELTGGVPKLMQWAANNPKDFYNIWARLLPSNTETAVGGTTINFVSPIGESPLDRVTINETGQVVTIDTAPRDEELPE